jgi:hypothetical protein
MNAIAACRGLLTNRPLSLLLGGEFVSAIGDWLYSVAILVVIDRETAYPATTDGSLLALDGPAFLELVGGGGAIRGRLQSLDASTPNR